MHSGGRRRNLSGRHTRADGSAGDGVGLAGRNRSSFPQYFSVSFEYKAVIMIEDGNGLCSSVLRLLGPYV